MKVLMNGGDSSFLIEEKAGSYVLLDVVSGGYQRSTTMDTFLRFRYFKDFKGDAKPVMDAYDKYVAVKKGDSKKQSSIMERWKLDSNDAFQVED